MYNGIGLQTPRGSGTNGYVQRNISAIRKTKEKVPDYQVKDDSAVRPFDPELVEHERRRQAEVRCMELRDLLEEQELSESEIEEKVNSFRAKLLAEKKLSYQRDASGRPLVKDSHEFSVAQEQKNERAKDAFGINRDFIPGSSLEGKSAAEMSEEGTTAVEVSATKTVTPPASSTSKSTSERSKKRKKSHKRSKRSSSSNSGSSSDDEVRHKKRKKEKKKKSKKSHRHRRHSDRSKKRRGKIIEQKITKDENGKSPSPRKGSPDNDTKAHTNPATISPSHISIASSRSPSPKILAESPVKAISDHDVDNSEIEEAINPRYSLSILDFSGNHKFYPSLPNNTNGVKNSHQRDSPVEVLKSTCIHLLTNLSTSKSTSASPIVDTNGNHQSNHKYCSKYRSSRSNSSGSKYSSRSRSPRLSLSPSEKSRSPSGSEGSHRRHRRSSSSRSRSSRNSRSISPHSHRSRSFSKSCSRSRSRSSSVSRYSRSHSSSRSSSKSRSRSRSYSSRSRTGSRKSESASPKSDRSRSPSIPRRRGSPSFMERRRITSARKRPIPYKRKDGVEWQVSSGSSSDSDDD